MRERQRNYPLPCKDDFAKVMHHLRVRKCTNPMERRRNLLFFYLLEETGARPQELLSLRFENVRHRAYLEIEGLKLG